MEEYTAISQNALVENTKIEFDVFLKNTVNGRSKYILFCRGNQQFSAESKEELLNKNEQKLYISSKDTEKYLQYQEKNLEQMINYKLIRLYPSQNNFWNLMAGVYVKYGSENWKSIYAALPLVRNLINYVYLTSPESFIAEVITYKTLT